MNEKQAAATTRMSIRFKEEDDIAQLNTSPQKGFADAEGEDKNDRKSEAKERRSLTEQEAEEQKLLQNYDEICALMSTIPPRDLEQEGAPFTEEFCQCLSSLADSFSEYQLEQGQVPYPVVKACRNKVAAIFLKHNTFELMCDVTSDTLKRRDFIGEDFEMDDESWEPLENLLRTLLYYSDWNGEVKLIITEHPELLPSLVQLLNDWPKLFQENTQTQNQSHLLVLSIGLVHNCGSMEENIPRLRELGVIQTVMRHMDSSSQRIRFPSIASLADLVNEEEAELLNTHVSIFKFILMEINNALETEDHRDEEFSAEELLRAVRQLARNDANKKTLVNEGCLPLLVKTLEVGNEEETKEALHCLWALSFDDDNKKNMVDEPGLVGKVYSIYKTDDEKSKQLKQACGFILWSLRDELRTSEKYKNASRTINEAVMKTDVSKSRLTPSTSKTNGHVMISYQWANQEVIKKITRELRAHRIPVWIDIVNMEGSTIEAMAKAVEESFIVIIAMSQKYKDSPNTRAEAEYAFTKKKKIIPLIMQQNYCPDGWLGLILGSKLFYDFSGKYPFESKMDELLKAILVGEDSPDGGVQPQTPPRLSQPPPVDEEAVKQWTPADVTKWLTRYKLENTPLQSLSGEEILFLHSLRNEAPEFFYRCLEKKLQISSLLDLANTTKALSDLKF